MKLRVLAITCLFGGGVALVLILFRSTPNETATDLEPVSSQVPESDSGPNGNHFLTEHGLPGGSGAQDLRLVGRAIGGMTRMFKGLDTRHVATNDQLADFLTGSNPEGLQYLDPELPIFQNGLLTDRWGQPYIVHPIGTGLLEIRTSGSDRIPYTEDDLVLRPGDTL